MASLTTTTSEASSTKIGSCPHFAIQVHCDKKNNQVTLSQKDFDSILDVVKQLEGHITNANRFSNLTSPFEEPHTHAFDTENAQHEDTMDEPLFFKIMCFCAGVYPILKKDGKWDITWKTIGWCIFPLIFTGLYGVVGTIGIIANTADYMKFTVYQQMYYLVSNWLYASIPITLSYTRKAFIQSIVGEENKVFMTQLVRKIFGICMCLGVVHGVAEAVLADALFHNTEEEVVLTVIQSYNQFGMFLLYCIYISHTSVAQYKNELITMVKGTNVETLQKQLWKISQRTKKASAAYIQIPLSLYFISRIVGFVGIAINIYKRQDASEFTIFIIVGMIVHGCHLILPLWFLTRIEKFYLWTLRELFHRNTSMPRTDYIALMMQYDTIAPRVHLFGIYLTRTLVSSILLALVGAVAPKAWSYFYDHM
jgi:hypothetical protein